MKLQAKHKNQTFEIIEDLPEVGFYLYIYDENNKCVADYLQNTEKDVKEFALKEFGVPLKSWTEKIVAMCCFCGENLDLDIAIQISIFLSQDSDESQTLFSHKQCLNNTLHKSVIMHPNLLNYK
jgi:hypothetical protein